MVPIQRKHQAMYDDFVKRKDMKREGYPSAPMHTLTTNGGIARFTLPLGVGVGTGAGGIGAREGGGVSKFDKHDPRQVREPVFAFHHIWRQQPEYFCSSNM